MLKDISTYLHVSAEQPSKLTPLTNMSIYVTLTIERTECVASETTAYVKVWIVLALKR